MRFRLYYDGPLRPNQRDPSGNQRDKLVEHKHQVRRVFHRQLRELWKADRFLNENEMSPFSFLAENDPRRQNFHPDAKLPMATAVALGHEQHGFRYVPLVRAKWELKCSLHILLLRRDPPGSVLTAGDIDNRIKTLIDTLRMPNSPNEMSGVSPPTADEDPFFCLLEDDQLVTEFQVDTDLLLDPPAGQPNEHQNVRAIIRVEVKPIVVTMFNLSFA